MRRFVISPEIEFSVPLHLGPTSRVGGLIRREVLLLLLGSWRLVGGIGRLLLLWRGRLVGGLLRLRGLEVVTQRSQSRVTRVAKNFGGGDHLSTKPMHLEGGKMATVRKVVRNPTLMVREIQILLRCTTLLTD